jgi:hypothetical protein
MAARRFIGTIAVFAGEAATDAHTPPGRLRHGSVILPDTPTVAVRRRKITRM